MAKTLHIAGGMFANFITTPNITYGNLFGYQDSDTGDPEATYQVPVRTAGTYSSFSYKNVASNISISHTVRFRKNGANGNQSVSVPANTSGTFTDTSNTDTIAAGDLISVQYDLSGGGGTGDEDMIYVYATFDTTTSTTLTMSKVCTMAPSGFAGMTGALATYYIPLNGFLGATNTTEASAQFKCQYAGTFKNLACRVRSNSRTTTTTVRFRKNGANGNLTVAYTSGQTLVKEDTANSDTVAAGDLVNFSVANGTGTGTAISWDYLSVEFHTTTDPGTGIQIAYNQTAQTQARNIPKYLPISGINLLTDDETDAQFKVPEAFTIKGIGINIATNTIASASTFALRVNGATSAATVPITSATSGWYQDLTHSVTLTAGDLINFILTTGVGSGSQTMTYRAFGLYIDFAGTTGLRNLTALMSETFSITSNHLRTTNRLRTITNPNITVTDTSYNKIRNKQRAVTDHPVINLAVTHNRLTTRIRTITSPNLAIASTHDKMTTRIKALSYNITLVANMLKFANKQRAVTDHPVINIAVTHNRLTNRLRTITNPNIAIISDHIRTKIIARTMTANITLVATHNRLVNKIRTISENVTIATPTFNRLTTRLRTISENFFITSLHSQDRSKFKFITETFSIASTHVKRTTRIKSITENIAIASTHDYKRNKLKTMTQNIGITLTSANRLTNRIRTITENVGITAATVKAMPNRVRLASHNIAIAVTHNRLTTRLRTITNPNITITGTSFNQSKLKIKTVAHNITIVSDHLRTRNLKRTMTDNVAITSTATRFKVLVQRTVSHNVTIGMTATMEFFKRFYVRLLRITGNR